MQSGSTDLFSAFGLYMALGLGLGLY